MKWWPISLLIIAVNAFGLHGRTLKDAPEAEQNAVVSGVGAIMETAHYTEEGVLTKKEEEKKKDLVRVIANAIYIGDNATGSVLLTQNNLLSEGETIADLLKMKLRFGITVSSRQAEYRSMRSEAPISEGSKLIKLPEIKGVSQTLGLLQLPYYLDRGRRPMPILKGDSLLVKGVKLNVYSHGSQFKVSPDDNAKLTHYDRDLTTGYLRYIPMILSGFYSKTALLQFAPLSAKALIAEFNGATDQIHPNIIPGPCVHDGAAPVVVRYRAANLKDEKIDNEIVALAGTFYGSIEVCVRRDSNPKNVGSGFTDIRHPKIQSWIEEHVTNLARPGVPFVRGEK